MGPTTGRGNTPITAIIAKLRPPENRLNRYGAGSSSAPPERPLAATRGDELELK